ncbi:MAG: QcrA and Rieske domain-containing protein [Planctomycetota bacterium]|jgi:Rieske Fe-S protein
MDRDTEFGTRRRGVLRLFAFVFGGICGGVGLGTLLDPLRKRGRRWLPLARFDQLVDGQATRVRFAVRAGWEQTERSVYLIRKGEEVVAFDARCTHLGCTVRFLEGEFRCPCHKGVFDADGRPLSGPVQTPLHEMDVRIRDGVVEGSA